MKLRYIVVMCMLVCVCVVSCVCVREAQPDVHVRIQEISTANHQFYVKVQVENRGIQKFDFLFDEPGIVTLTDNNGDDVFCVIRPREGGCASTTLLPKSTQEYMFDILVLVFDDFYDKSNETYGNPYTLTVALPPTVPNAEAKQTFYVPKDFFREDGVHYLGASAKTYSKVDTPPYLAIQSCTAYRGGEIKVLVHLYNYQEDQLLFYSGLPMSLFDCKGDTVAHAFFQPGGNLLRYSIPFRKTLLVPTHLSVDTPVTNKVYTVRIHHPSNADYYVDTQFQIPEKGPAFPKL